MKFLFPKFVAAVGRRCRVDLVANPHASSAQPGTIRSERRPSQVGYIKVVDTTKTYVAQIAENETDGDAYRLWIPKGSRYLLHLTDANFATSDSPSDPIPTKSISLNQWQQGADTVLSCTIYWENNAPRIVVHSKTEELFNHVLPDWNGASGPSELTWFQAGQKEYNANQNIQLMLWRNTTSQRGILLWLEPLANSEKRRAAIEKTPASRNDESPK